MSGREWQPGDVAMLKPPSGPEFMVVRTSGGGEYDYWSAPKGWPTGVSDYECGARPLVVIDPEDRKVVERLRHETVRMLREQIGNRGVDESAFTEGDLANAMQAALREFANPKPAEPTGLGAVVEDANGRLWFRMALENQAWPGEVWQGQYDEADRWSKWESVNAVRVLSEGVAQ